jgi:putative heme iron utilization protein
MERTFFHLLSRTIAIDAFPEAEQLFSLGDFNIWKITPKGGRFVAGFGRAFNLVPEMFSNVAHVL